MGEYRYIRIAQLWQSFATKVVPGELKRLFAPDLSFNELETLVFDEVDSGIVANGFSRETFKLVDRGLVEYHLAQRLILILK